MGENGNILDSSNWGLGDEGKEPKEPVTLSPEILDDLDQAEQIQDEIRTAFTAKTFGQNPEADLEKWQQMEAKFGMGQMDEIPLSDTVGEETVIPRPKTARLIDGTEPRE